MRPVALVIAILAAQAAWAVSLPSFSDYEVILLKKPFGDLGSYTKAVVSDASQREAELQSAQEKKEIQSLARQLSLVAINRTPGGEIAVGLVDRSEKVPRSLYLRIGESNGKWKVSDADFTLETATIENGGLSFTLKLGKGLVDENLEPLSLTPDGLSQLAKTDNGNSRETMATGFRQPPAPDAFGGVNLGGESYRNEVRKRRMAENRARVEEKERLKEELKGIAENTSKEAAAKREREINLELISRGEMPLSEIVLTEEEDAELVRKGVLPGE